MTCPSCGHTNDAGNRFCEYCGARLDPALNQEATVQQMGPPSFGSDASYDAPTMFVPTEEAASSAPAPTSSAPDAKEQICGVCGYANQPGDRFCDQCGAALSGQDSAPAAAPAAAPAGDASQSIEPLPDGEDDRTVVGSFTSPDQMATSGWQAPAFDQPDQAAPAGQSISDMPTPPGGTPMVTPAAAATQGGAAGAPDSLLAEMVMSPVPDDESPTVPTPPDEAPTYDRETAPSAQPAAGATAPDTAQPVASAQAEPSAAAQSEAPAASAPAEPDAESAPVAAAEPSGDRTSLEAAIQEHRDNLAMFEQMASRYQGRAVPAHITAGLEESRASLDEAEARLRDFDAAQAATAQPDPAELERLNGVIQEHRDNLAMFEQMASRYQGRAVPAHITAGLEESRASLDAAEAELAALQGGAAAPASAAPATAVAAPAEAELVSTAPPAQAVPAEDPAAPAPAPMPAAAEAAPAPTPMPATPAAGAPAPMPVLKPRLSVESSGATLELPTDKPVIVVGREDPISGIYPEVDLTPHGGESGGVSRQHARLLHDGGNWRVEDLNSTNYTKVNGTKIAPNTPTDLNDGDKVNFGRVVLTFHKG